MGALMEPLFEILKHPPEGGGFRFAPPTGERL